MKPWFEKELAEADIIKFPVPQAKVIQMPNVQEYPDFITGVQDLQAKQKDGTISQESYDKLYAELIHRFMKKESFETPWYLREDKTTNIDQKIDQLVQIGKQDPEKSDTVSNILNRIIQYGQKILGQEAPKTEQVQPATLDQSGVSAQQIIDLICQKLPAQCDKPITNVNMFLTKAFKEIVKKEKEQGFQQRTDIRQDLAKAINLVAGKVTNTLEQLEQHYKQQAAEGDRISIKSSPGEEAIRKEITDLLRGLIESYRDTHKDPKEFEQFETLILQFLNDSIKGIVPLKRIIAVGSGDITTEVQKTKYKSLVDNGFIEQLLRKIPAGTGGNWGPGELGLAIIGSPVMKGKKGDIEVSGEKIEIKASATATQGGRITPDALIGEGTDGKAEYTKAFNTFLKTTRLNKLIKPAGDFINYTKTTLRGKESAKKTKYTNFGRSLFRDIINVAIDQLPNKKISRRASAEFVKNSIIAAFKSEFKSQVKKLVKVNQSIDANGKISFEGVMAEYIKVLGYFYNTQKGVKKILVINPRDSHFEVISTENPEGIAEKLKIGTLQTGATAIDFNLPHMKPSPQIGTQKGGRQKQM